MKYKGYEITADVKLYQWFTLDEEGIIDSPETPDKEIEEIVQYCGHDKDTGDEIFSDSIEKVKQYVDGRQYDRAR